MRTKRRRTLAPLVGEERWRLSVGGFDPGREQTPLISLVPQVLVEVSVCDLLERLHVIHRHQVAVQIHELYPRLKQTQYNHQLYLEWLHVIHWQQVAVQIHELYPRLKQTQYNHQLHLERLHVIHRHQVAVQVHELYPQIETNTTQSSTTS